MSGKENLKIIHRMYEEALNAHNIEAHDKFWAQDMIWHGPLEEIKGLTAFKDSLRPYFLAFPDYYATHIIEMVDGDMVAATGYFTATHSDLIYGVPATGKKVIGWFSDFWRIEKGLIAENWVQVDYLGILRQLGVKID